jgi:hypothetical protein
VVVVVVEEEDEEEEEEEEEEVRKLADAVLTGEGEDDVAVDVAEADVDADV